MDWSIPVGEFAPVIIALIVAAFGWVMILLENRRRRLAAAARLGPAERPDDPGGPVRQSLPLSREVFEHFRAMGPGWQARIDEVLKRHVREVEDRARRRVGEAEEARPRVAEEREPFLGEDE